LARLELLKLQQVFDLALLILMLSQIAKTVKDGFDELRLILNQHEW
jgi:hypothetical protein